MSESPRELHYILPFEEAKKGNFRKLFEALDSSLVDLHVNSYGIMDTTLEEIFLKITEAACQEEEGRCWSLEMWECLCYCLEMQLEDDLLKLAHDAFFFLYQFFS